VNPFQVYTTFLSIKNHFTLHNYNYFTYKGKVRANLKSFYKRNDRFYFEKMSRQKSDEEIVNFFVSNFVSCDDPQSLWIGEIIKEGDQTYKQWIRKTQSLTYIFKNEVSILNPDNFDEMFEIEGNKHPKILKQFLQNKLSLETMIVLNNILKYKNNFDDKLKDPVWESVSMKIEKYTPFLQIDNNKFKTLLKECVL
jgi:hypothetical protein